MFKKNEKVLIKKETDFLKLHYFKTDTAGERFHDKISFPANTFLFFSYEEKVGKRTMYVFYKYENDLGIFLNKKEAKKIFKRVEDD